MYPLKTLKKVEFTEVDIEQIIDLRESLFLEKGNN